LRFFDFPEIGLAIDPAFLTNYLTVVVIEVA